MLTDIEIEDGQIHPLGTANGSIGVSDPVPAAMRHQYHDEPILHLLTDKMRVNVIKFLKLARHHDHTVQPIPSAHMAPYPHKTKGKPGQRKVVISRDAIRVLYVGDDGRVMHPDHVPAEKWRQLAGFAHQSGLAPGLWHPHGGDKAYFALDTGHTLHGEQNKKEKGKKKESVPREGKTEKTLWEEKVGSLGKALDWSKEAALAPVEAVVKGLKVQLRAQVESQIKLHVKLFQAQGLDKIMIHKWKKAAEAELEKLMKDKNTSKFEEEVKNILTRRISHNSKIRADQSFRSQAHQAWDKTRSTVDKAWSHLHGKTSSDPKGGAPAPAPAPANPHGHGGHGHGHVDPKVKALEQQAEGLEKEAGSTFGTIETAEKVTSKLKLFGNVLIVIDVACTAQKVWVICQGDEKGSKKLEESMEAIGETAAGIAEGILVPLGAGMLAEAATGAAIGAMFGGVGAVPGAVVGVLVGTIAGILLADPAKKAGGFLAKGAVDVAEHPDEAWKKLVELFDPKDTKLYVEGRRA